MLKKIIPTVDNCTLNKFSCCIKHNRFHQMRAQAKRSGKKIPKFKDLENLYLSLRNFQCQPCGKAMQWTSASNGRKGDSVSLQHNRDGSLALICHSCNSKLVDGYIESGFYGKSHKIKACALCEVELPREAFYLRHRNKPNELDPLCKPCRNQTFYAYAKLKTKKAA